MTESSIRNAKIGCGVFALLFFGSIYTYFHFAQRARITAMREVRGPRGVPVSPESSRVAEIRTLEYTDPEKGVALADGILAAPKSDEEQRATLSLLPQLLQNAAFRRLKAGQTVEARAF